MSFKAKLNCNVIQRQYGLQKGTVVDVYAVGPKTGTDLGPWCVIDHPSLPHVCYVNAEDLKLMVDDVSPLVYS